MAKMQKKNTATQAPIKIQFHRWLLPAVLTVTFYLVSVLVSALVIERQGGLSPEANFLTTALFSLALASALWWLVESARWAIIHIDQRAARKRGATKSTTKKTSKKVVSKK